MAGIRVACPKCSAQYSIDEANLGKRARCKRCGTAFVLAATKTPRRLGVS